MRYLADSLPAALITPVVIPVAANPKESTLLEVHVFFVGSSPTTARMRDELQQYTDEIVRAVTDSDDDIPVAGLSALTMVGVGEHTDLVGGRSKDGRRDVWCPRTHRDERILPVLRQLSNFAPDEGVREDAESAHRLLCLILNESSY
jgi:hypothetical protein